MPFPTPPRQVERGPGGLSGKSTGPVFMKQPEQGADVGPQHVASLPKAG